MRTANVAGAISCTVCNVRGLRHCYRETGRTADRPCIGKPRVCPELSVNCLCGIVGEPLWWLHWFICSLQFLIHRDSLLNFCLLNACLKCLTFVDILLLIVVSMYNISDTSLNTSAHAQCSVTSSRTRESYNVNAGKRKLTYRTEELFWHKNHKPKHMCEMVIFSKSKICSVISVTWFPKN